MSYGIDLPAAARRHFVAAGELVTAERRDVAGYLYGIAAECGVKAMMIEAGMRPVAEHRTQNDPFFLHFPELRTVLRDRLQGRRGTPLTKFLQSDTFMNNWSTKMRYCHGREVKSNFVDLWSEQASQVISSIGA